MDSGEQSKHYYETAKRFWHWYQTDPDSDFMIENPTLAIANTLTRQGAHPIQAMYVSRIALDSVCDRDLEQAY